MQAGCATVAILLHYFFLTSFMWVLMEGIVLYIMLVQVFAQINWKYYTAFTALSYGKANYEVYISNRLNIRWSVTVHGVVYSIGTSKNRWVELWKWWCVSWHYTIKTLTFCVHHNSCWLTYDDHFIWAFIAPVIVIIIVSKGWCAILISELLLLQINVGFLVMAMRIMYKHRDTAKSKKGSVWYVCTSITWYCRMI